MKTKLKQQYEKIQKKEKIKTILKWVLCGVGWSSLLLLFVGSIVLGTKSCRNKKQETAIEERLITREDISNIIYEVDTSNGTTTPVQTTEFTTPLQLNDYGGVDGTTYTKNYMIWAQYTWNRQTAQNTTYNSWFTSKPENAVNFASLKLNFNNLNNGSNGYIGSPAPLCELIYTYKDISSVGGTQVVSGGYDIQEITAINMYENYIEFKHIRNNNLTQNIYYAQLTKQGLYDNDRNVTRVIDSLTINFYRFYDSDFYDPLFATHQYENGYPLVVSYSMSEDRNTIFDILNQHMTFNKMFFNFEKYYIDEDMLNVAPRSYHMTNKQSYVSKNSYPYESTNPTTQVYDIGHSPTIIDGGDSGGSSSSGYLDVFTLITQAFNSIGGILNLELLPGLKLGTLFAVPIVLTLVLFVVWLFKR